MSLYRRQFDSCKPCGRAGTGNSHSCDSTTGLRRRNAPTLSWNSVSTASSYAVQVSMASGFASTVTTVGSEGASVFITGLAGSTNYFWRGGAKNAGGLAAGQMSGFSNDQRRAGSANACQPVERDGERADLDDNELGSLANFQSYSIMVSTASSFATTVSNQTGLTGVSAALSGLPTALPTTRK